VLTFYSVFEKEKKGGDRREIGPLLRSVCIIY